MRVPAAAGGRWLATVALVLLVLGACGGDNDAERGDDGEITEAGTVGVLRLEEGDCIVVGEKSGDPAVEEDDIDIESVEGIPCAEPHSHEVFAEVDLGKVGGDETRFGPGAPYPGEAALGKEAEAHCADAFSDYVGTDYLESDLFFTYLVPSVASWQDRTEKDRTIICLAMGDGGPFEGSVEGSKL